MKSTMNKRDIAKYHKLLAEEVSIDKISKFLKIDKATLKKFTPKGVKPKAAAAAEKPAEKE